MSVRTAVSLGLAVLLCVVLWLFVIPPFWRGERKKAAHQVYWYVLFLSPPARRGLYRALVATAISASLVVLGIGLATTADNMEIGARSPMGTIGMTMAGVGFLAFFVVVPMIMVFNRPKVLVPPYLRRQPGLATLWVRANRIWRAERAARRDASWRSRKEGPR